MSGAGSVRAGNGRTSISDGFYHSMLRPKNWRNGVQDGGGFGLPEDKKGRDRHLTTPPRSARSDARWALGGLLPIGAFTGVGGLAPVAVLPIMYGCMQGLSETATRRGIGQNSFKAHMYGMAKGTGKAVKHLAGAGFLVPGSMGKIEDSIRNNRRTCVAGVDWNRRDELVNKYGAKHTKRDRKQQAKTGGWLRNLFRKGGGDKGKGIDAESADGGTPHDDSDLYDNDHHNNDRRRSGVFPLSEADDVADGGIPLGYEEFHDNSGQK
jgi:hypothetical protein